MRRRAGRRRGAGQRRRARQRSDAAVRTSATTVRCATSPQRSGPATGPSSTNPASARRCRAPGKGLGVALNYRKHAEETGRPAPDEPALFGKTDNCVCGPFDPIVVPDGRASVDYEAELVIVFGRTCKAATADDGVDVPRRRHRRPGHQRPGGAAPPAGQPVHDRQELRHVRSDRSVPRHGRRARRPGRAADRVRRQRRVLQSSNTNDLIFGVPALVEWLSRYMTFHAGDLVWTGHARRASARHGPRRASCAPATSSRRPSAASARCATRCVGG